MLKVPSSVAARRPTIRLPIGLAPLTDERLARLVEGGTEQAFATIYERYQGRLYRYCYALLHDREDACDALQSTLAIAFEALQRGERDVPLRPWLFGIAHGEAISLSRRSRAQGEITEAAERWVESAEERAVERARLAMIIADLGQLPERQRGALLMRELSGLSHRDIALALAISPGAVKGAISDARRSLAEFEEGRDMCCEDVRKIISFGGGPTLRRRRVRSHLRDCAGCTAFVAAISERSGDLRAIGAPLGPALASGTLGRLLARLLGRGSGHGLGGAGATGAAGGAGTGGAGSAAGVSLAAKCFAVVAVMAPAAAATTGAVAIAKHYSRPPAPAPALGATALPPGDADRQAGTTERRALAAHAGERVRIAVRRSSGGVGGPSGSPLQSLGPPIAVALVTRSASNSAAQLAIDAWGPFRGPTDEGAEVGARARGASAASPEPPPEDGAPDRREHPAPERTFGRGGEEGGRPQRGAGRLPAGAHRSEGARESAGDIDESGAPRGGAGGGAGAASRRGADTAPGSPEGGPGRSVPPGGSSPGGTARAAEPRDGGEAAPGGSHGTARPRAASRPAGKCTRIALQGIEEAPGSPAASVPGSPAASVPAASAASTSAATAPVTEAVC